MALTAAVVLAGCTTTPPVDSGPPPPPALIRQAFDPPTAFGPPELTLGLDTAIPVPQVLDGIHGWSLAEGGLTRTDLSTGEMLTGGFPRTPLFAGLDVSRPTAIGAPDVLRAPVLADLPAGRRVLAAWPVEQPGQGTTPPQRGIELVSADPQTAQTLTAATVPLPGTWLEASLNGFTVYVAGVVGTTAIVSAAAADTALTAAVDLESGRLVWSVPDVAARLLTDDTVVVGLRDLAKNELRGLALTDGRPRWAGVAGSTVWPVGASHALVDLQTVENAWGGSQVINTATGRPVDSPLNGQRGWSCRSDQQNLTICSLAPYTGTDAVLAFDDDGTELWRIARDSGRTVPTVTAAWHGMVYGYTDAGPVILDGRTGTDRVPAASAAPLLVSAYIGVTADADSPPELRPTPGRGGRLIARPTTG